MLLIKFIQELDIIKKISSIVIYKEKVQWQKNIVQVILISPWLLVFGRNISSYTTIQMRIRESEYKNY